MVANGTTAAVRLTGVEKSFGSSKILNDIALEFRAGEVHALIGENGAGKSSVGKIIGGYYSADRGQVEISGTPLDQSTPRRALQLGVAMIHQELQLVPQLTVAENVFLGLEANVAGVLSGSDNKRFAVLEELCRFGLDPRRKAGDLSIADRQKVEIMRAIARDARIIIMDEPTSSLTADEAERLHRVIADLRAQGRTIIYVTHFLDHVLAACDRVTIMRDGRVVRTGEIASETKQSLVEAMLGKSAEVAYPELPARPDASIAPRIEMHGISTDAGIHDINLAIRPGEVVGPGWPCRLRPQRSGARLVWRGPSAERHHQTRWPGAAQAFAQECGPPRHRLRAGRSPQAGAQPGAAYAAQYEPAPSQPDQPPRLSRHG
jgi:ribose transport system ATP-binding protein